MRSLTVSRLAENDEWSATSSPPSAKTCASPCPIRPAPMTVMRALAMSARRIAAVGIEDVTGIEVGGTRGEEQERPRQIRRLAEPPLGDARQKALADIARPIGLLIHPARER